MFSLPGRTTSNSKPECADWVLAQRKVLAMTISEQPGLTHVYFAILVDKRFLDLIGNNLCQEQIVLPEIRNRSDLTLQSNRTHCQGRDGNRFPWLKLQPEMLDLIDFSARTTSTKVRHFSHFHGGQVDDKLSCGFQVFI